jgi:hypothetical protein
MIDTPLESAAALVRGALSIEHTPNGITPVRLPTWAVEQAPNAYTRESFRFASGVRLALTTNASTLEVDVAVSQSSFADFGPPEGAFLRLVFDLRVNCHEAAQQTPGDGSTLSFSRDGELLESTPRAVVTLRFDGISHGASPETPKGP